jgi:hypothetical protein
MGTESGAGTPLGTVIIEAGPSIDLLAGKLALATIGATAGRHRIVIACDRGREQWLAERLPERFRGTAIAAIEACPPIDTPRVAFLPADAEFSPPGWRDVPPEGMIIRPWVRPIIPLEHGAMGYAKPATAWAAPVAVLRAVLGARLRELRLDAVVACLERQGVPLSFRSTQAFAEGTGTPPAVAGPPRLHRGSRVLAIVPHFRCEAWLGLCLRSLTAQTRAPQSIVVVDDASPTPPRDIVASFPGVTLLCSRENVGPFRLVQTVIEKTRFDAYMFQDADDWSASDRLALLLDGAERTGAELIGCQELRFDLPDGVSAHCYVPNASRSLGAVQRYSILHPTSLVSRDLVSRVGGFATGVKFGGDLEFQLRAHHCGHVVNIERYGYFRRQREGSLWTSPDTGRHSAVRQTQVNQIVERARANARAVALGQAPDLRPFRHAGPIALEHLLGPALF